MTLGGKSTIDLYWQILYAGAMSRSLRTYYASKNKVAKGPKVWCTPCQCGCGSDFYFQVRDVDIKTVLISPNASLQHSITPVFHYSTAFEYGTANLP
jgi:hypothetical protein